MEEDPNEEQFLTNYLEITTLLNEIIDNGAILVSEVPDIFP